MDLILLTGILIGISKEIYLFLTNYRGNKNSLLVSPIVKARGKIIEISEAFTF